MWVAYRKPNEAKCRITTLFLTFKPSIMTMFVGRITKNATVNQLKDERKVVNFDVAINDYYKSKSSGQTIQAVTYITCAYWMSPKIAERLTKGSLVEISGRLYVTAYKSFGGDVKGTLHCHVNNIKIHSQGKDELAESTQTVTPKEAVVEDLPF